MKEQKLSCSTCRFCEDIGKDAYVCRRNPPQLVKMEDAFYSLFPPILDKDNWWCGEYTQPFSSGSN